jgi:hypothetical protein
VDRTTKQRSLCDHFVAVHYVWRNLYNFFSFSFIGIVGQ